MVVSGCLVAAVTVTGCGGSGPPAPVRVEKPIPAPRAAPLCRRLVGDLPESLDGRPRAPAAPASPYTAAWGDPPVVLRCGVDPPHGFTTTSQVIEVDAVAWFLVERRAAYVFTTVGRRAFVEVLVPRSVPRAEVTAPLVDLARPVIKSVPTAADAAKGT